jgi:hypothetical protein
MSRLALALLLATILLSTTRQSAADQTTTFGLEEAFVDAVATCGPSSSAARVIGKNSDPAVQIALRNAEIIEAADAAAEVPGSSKPLEDCRQRFLTGRGYNKSEMTVLPECTKQDWPSLFTSLGQCVHARGGNGPSLGNLRDSLWAENAKDVLGV